METKIKEQQNQWSLMFGELLLSKMYGRRINSLKLSMKSGLSKKQVDRIIYGENGNPRLYTIMAFADALDIHPKTLFNFNMDKKYTRAKREYFFLTPEEVKYIRALRKKQYEAKLKLKLKVDPGLI